MKIPENIAKLQSYTETRNPKQSGEKQQQKKINEQGTPHTYLVWLLGAKGNFLLLRSHFTKKAKTFKAEQN